MAALFEEVVPFPSTESREQGWGYFLSSSICNFKNPRIVKRSWNVKTTHVQLRLKTKKPLTRPHCFESLVGKILNILHLKIKNFMLLTSGKLSQYLDYELWREKRWPGFLLPVIKYKILFVFPKCSNTRFCSSSQNSQGSMQIVFSNNQSKNNKNENRFRKKISYLKLLSFFKTWILLLAWNF